MRIRHAHSSGLHRTPAKPVTFLATVGVIVGDSDLPGSFQNAARNLNIQLRPFRGPNTGNDAQRGNPCGPDQQPDRGELIAFGTMCDVLTIGPSIPAPTQLGALVAAGITLRPNRHAVELSRDPVATRRILSYSGFDVTTTPEGPAVKPTNIKSLRCGIRRFADPAAVFQPAAGPVTVVVARRPSGHLVAYPATGPGARHPDRPGAVQHRAVEAAISIANGIDVTGVVNVHFEVVEAGPFVKEVTLGPKLGRNNHATVSLYENHLRALLDWPLAPTNAALPAACRWNHSEYLRRL